MTPHATLAQFLDRMARRLRLYVWVRGASQVIASALVLTLTIAAILTWLPPSPSGLAMGRLLLWLGIGVVAVAAIVIPLKRLNAARVAIQVERAFPRFAQRIVTFLERKQNHPDDPFLALLEADTFDVAREATQEGLVDPIRLSRVAASGAAGGFVLVWLILWSTGPLSPTAQALWTGNSVFSVEIKSARKTIRRGADLLVTARPVGFHANSVELWIRYQGSQVWRRSPMQAEPPDSGFAHELEHLMASAEYYAEADGVKSSVSRVNVVDLPVVKNIRVVYPNESSANESDGDIVAPAGTVARLNIETDRPMNGGQLVLELEDPIYLPSTRDNKSSASLIVLRDDGYHVSVLYEGEAVPISDEHAIEVLTGETKPGRTASLLQGVRSGAVPAGYEKAVDAYYKRLSELEQGH